MFSRLFDSPGCLSYVLGKGEGFDEHKACIIFVRSNVTGK